jgi:hypothetical protein
MDPAIVNIVTNIIDAFWNPAPNILNVIQSFFSYPKSHRVFGLSFFLPLIPTFRGGSPGLHSATKPVGKF